jgi:hypothetical protein
MMCERYWRDGVLIAEQGQRDPHRDTCADCRKAHAARDELIRALPVLGAGRSGDPGWQMKVWSRIARHEAQRARRSFWIGAGATAVCATAAIWLLLFRGPPTPPQIAPHSAEIAAAADTDRPKVVIVSGQLAMRSTSARVGDTVRILVAGDGEVRVYRANLLVLRCPAHETGPGCTPDRLGLVAEAVLATAGDYQLMILPTHTADAVGTLDKDLAAVVNAGGDDYKLIELQVR